MAGVNIKCMKIIYYIWEFSDFILSPLVPASRNELQSIRLQLESETFPPERPGDPPRSFHSLPPVEQANMEKKRLAGRTNTCT